MNIQRSILACAVALAASVSVTYAGPCTSEITQVRDVISARIHEKARTATAPEGTAATMHRQPTQRSIGAVEMETGQTSPGLFNEVHAGMVLATSWADVMALTVFILISW